MHYDPDQKKLTLRGAGRFPREIFEYAADVEILDMSSGHLSALPDDLGRLKNLRIAFFSNNDFETVPEVLSTCRNLEMVGLRSCKIRTVPERSLPTSLRGLILTDNQISHLPRSIGELTQLQKIMIAGNQLESLPEEIMACQKLELLRLSVNNLASSPDWLLQLPCLAWYADSSNQFNSHSHPDSSEDQHISWHDIMLGGELGRSVNNIVHRASLKTGEEVAVKLFGQALVTDGLAADDMKACLLAGRHPNVVGGLGRLVNTPNQQPALVMPLISGEFKNLGKPPDFTTISRDVYPEDHTFSPPYALQVLKSVAAAMTHLHAKGVMHGDLYAHNILTNATGQSYLGDFGSASIYKPGTPGGRLREQIDVRGFGHLTDELVARCPASAGGASIITKLRNLKAACLNETPAQRPLFADINNLLAA